MKTAVQSTVQSAFQAEIFKVIYRSVSKLLMLPPILAVSMAVSSVSAAADKPDVVYAGVSPTTSTSGVFIALERGYFKDENLNVDLKVFAASTAPMLPLVAKGELDVGGGVLTAGIFSAYEEGVRIQLVADKGSVLKEADYLQLLIRSDLVASGKYKSFKDLRGMKIGMTALGGTSLEAAFARFLAKGGLTPKDVTFVKVSYPDANKALETRRIDGVVQLEPYLSAAIKGGYAKSVAGVYSVHPGQQSASLFYSPKFVKERRDVAIRFMKAYIRGIRDHNEAFVKKDPNQLEAIVKILQKWTSVKEASTYREMIPAGLRDDGRLNVASMKEDVKYYLEQGYLKSEPNWDGLVDVTIVEEALKALATPKKR